MEKLQRLTVDEIKNEYPGAYVESFDAGLVEDGDNTVKALDVIVWETEADAAYDDGTKAIARYLIPA